MDLRRLAVFAKVAEFGSFSQAFLDFVESQAASGPSQVT
jgi:hypothetical protein